MAPEFGRPIHQLPFIPANVLKKHHVHEPLDTRFRSAARLLQALWREDRALPIGTYVNEDGKRRKLGSRISEAAEFFQIRRGSAGFNPLDALAHSRYGLSNPFRPFRPSRRRAWREIPSSGPPRRWPRW
jgi:hypothetical protein